MNTSTNIVLDQPETDAKVLRISTLKKSGVVINLKPEFRTRALMEMERMDATIRLVPHDHNPDNPHLEVYFPDGYVTAGDGCTSLLCHDWQDIYDRLKHETLIADPEANVKDLIDSERGLAECQFDDASFMLEEAS